MYIPTTHNRLKSQTDETKRPKSEESNFSAISEKMPDTKMNVIEWQTYKVTPDIVREYSPRAKKNRVPLIIDNGKQRPFQ